MRQRVVQLLRADRLHGGLHLTGVPLKKSNPSGRTFVGDKSKSSHTASFVPTKTYSCRHKAAVQRWTHRGVQVCEVPVGAMTQLVLQGLGGNCLAEAFERDLFPFG